jgi:carboxymethylenebutenolidase
MGEMVEITADVGSIEGYLALPQGGHGAGVLLLHAWWGLNDFFKSLADRLASEGFVVLAPDLYGGSIASTIEEAERVSATLDYRQAIKHVEAGMDHLLRHPATVGGKIAVVGFSMGAAYATWLTTLRPEAGAVVLFYGGAEWGEDFALQTRAAFLGHFAENDPYESTDAMRQFEQQLHAAGKEVAFHVYPGTGHWFFEHDRPDAYNEEAAGLAWQRTLEFLRANLP